jgi:CBS domain-containing protein
VRTRIVSVAPDETVQLAIARMVEENVGSVAVCEGPRLVGIFTERDVLRLASGSARFREVKVGAVMTRSPFTVPPDVNIMDAARLMTRKEIRHLPVVEGENLLGMLGIRDVMRTLVEQVWSRHDEAARNTARELLQSRG